MRRTVVKIERTMGVSEGVSTPQYGIPPGDRTDWPESSQNGLVPRPQDHHLRTVPVGGLDTEALRAALAAAGIQLNAYAEALLASPAFRPRRAPEDVTITVVSLPWLGLREGGTFAEIVGRAAKRGLDLCALDVGPYLRLAMSGQPLGPYLTVASPPPGPDEERPNGFYLRRLDDGLWLRGYVASADHVYAADFGTWAFRAL